MHHIPIEPPAAGLVADYDPVTLRERHDGWTADRQRNFLIALGETGCISEACRQAGITARSAYRLRAHPGGARFAAAWDQALRYAAAKLTTLAYERAIVGTTRELWRNDQLVAESRQPSDKLLMFLLSNFAPTGGHRARLEAETARAAAAFAPMLGELRDSDVPAELLSAQDFEARPPVHAHDRLHAPEDLYAGEADWEDEQ